METDLKNEPVFDRFKVILEILVLTEEDFIDTQIPEESTRLLSIDIANITHLIKHFASDLRNFYVMESEKHQEVFSLLKNDVQEVRSVLSQKKFSFKEERIYYLNQLENVVLATFKEPVQIKSVSKLQFTGDKKVLYDLIRQVKKKVIEGNRNFLPQTNRELASFLVHCVEGFEDGDIENIANEIGRKHEFQTRHFKVEAGVWDKKEY